MKKKFKGDNATWIFKASSKTNRQRNKTSQR